MVKGEEGKVKGGMPRKRARKLRVDVQVRGQGGRQTGKKGEVVKVKGKGEG